MAVDCIIFGFDDEGLKLLLAHRKLEPCKGMRSLMGGFVNERESVDEAANRVLYDLTGMKDIYLEQLYTYGDVMRDTAGRVISVAYYALIQTDKFKEITDKDNGAQWFLVGKTPDLIFDHGIMVEKALARLSRRVRYQPVGFELLPDKFTLPQLQRLYEAIYQQKIDKRNFRKRILAMNLLVKLNEKDKEGSKRGAFYFRFDESRYEELVNNGFFFELK